MTHRFLLCACLATLLVGCQKPAPTIDGRSNVAFQASIENVSAALDDDTREKFFLALGTVANRLIDSTDIDELQRIGPMELTQITTQKLRKKLDGYTAVDVIYLARQIREEDK